MNDLKVVIRMKRRILPLLAVFLLFSQVLLTKAADIMEMRVLAPVEVPAVGEEFSVSIVIRGNPGLNTFQMTLLYDRTTLECLEVEAGPVTESMMIAKNPNNGKLGGATVAAVSLKAQTADGTAVVFRFRVLSAGAIVPRSLTEVQITDYQGIAIPYTLIQCDLTGEAMDRPADAQSDGGGTAPPAEDAGTLDGGGTAPPAEETGTLDGGGQPIPSGETQEAAGTEWDASTVFTDISGHWAGEYIAEAVEQGFINGFPDGTFRPNDAATRAQFVTMLWRIAGCPSAEAELPFDDVSGEAWYAPAVSWAYEQGYINGRTETTFDPDDHITRQEVLKILFYRAGGVSGIESMFFSIYEKEFADSGEIAPWAKAAIYWGYYHGLIKGRTAETLCPKDTATRAELAKILTVFSKEI